MRLCLLLFLLRSCLACSDGVSDEVSVELSTGKVAGLKVVSAVNKKYYSFQGIPYAAPPIGFLRFKAPQPPDRWNGTLKAFEIPPACAQPRRKVQFPEKYSEDCLYINVFTPYLEPPEGNPLPVMVWIHGGKHYQGSSTKYKYGPDFLLTSGVVLVTFNYRIGVFGYLNLNTRSAQGNAGLKDMVAALRWVKKEIKHFGGDPNKVTIFGGSSGGQDVNCLYLSPLAEGLFHRAISQSAQFCGTVEDAEPIVFSHVLAERLGCDDTILEDAVTCLRGFSTQVLAEKQMELLILQPGEMANPFLQSVEGDHGEEAVLPLPAFKLLAASNSSVPYLLGLNSGEGKLYLDVLSDYPNPLIDFEKLFERYLPESIQYKTTSTSLKYIVNVLKKFYFHNNIANMDSIDEYVNFMTDRKFTYDIVTYASSLSTHAPVYLYLFAFQGAFQAEDNSFEGINVTGVGHGKELGYLFFRNSLIESHNHLEDFPLECGITTRMTRLWTNFAKYGNPTPVKDDPVLGATWLPMNGSVTRHLVINQTLVMNTSTLWPERVQVWAEVYTIAEHDLTESSWSIAIKIVVAVCVLSLASLAYLLYDCCCRTRHYDYDILD